MKSRRCFCIFALAYFIGASSFSQIQNGKYVFQNETVLVAYSAHVFKDVDLADARAVSSLLLQEILDNWALNLGNRVVIYEDMNMLKRDIRDDVIDIIALTTPEYFMLRTQIKIIPFLTYMLSDRILDRMLLITRKDSRIKSVNGLKGRKIAVYSNLSDEFNLPSLWFTTLVLRNGGNYRADYASTVYKVRKGTNAISDVFFNNADAAVIPEMEFNIAKELNPQIGVQLGIIDSSRQMLYSVLCYTDKLTTAMARYKDRNLQSISDLLCNANKTDVGRHFLSIFRITSFVPYQSAYLNETEKLFNDFRILSADHNRRSK